MTSTSLTEMNYLNLYMLDIFDQLDNIYFELKLMLLAISMDDIASLVEPEIPTFDPFKTIGKYC